jgi:hypothetical protein
MLQVSHTLSPREKKQDQIRRQGKEEKKSSGRRGRGGGGRRRGRDDSQTKTKSAHNLYAVHLTSFLSALATFPSSDPNSTNLDCRRLKEGIVPV